MKIEIETTAATDNSGPSGHIRLYPESNSEVAQLAWILKTCTDGTIKFADNSGLGGVMMYTISLKGLVIGGTSKRR